ncbi:MAG: putative glycoside hydrolase, partial [Actinomycetia bacterium]|nr:putative glycoside hydrolase [Actinomycetes bacterium]
MSRWRLLSVFAALAALAAALTAIAPSAGAVGNPPHDKPVTVPADDFPDPAVLRVGSTWYAYGTDGDLGNVQVVKSNDLVTWTSARAGGALPAVPSWGQNDDVWAPGIHNTGAGYVLYSAVVSKATGKRCIAAATSSAPEGPFAANQSFQLCNDGEGGIIDPDVFVGAGGTFLLWKTEGVPGTVAPAIWSQPLAANGLLLTGTASRIFSSQYPWEGTLVENPTMVSAGGRLFLFYSGNEWESAAYGVGWAVCPSVQGPCVAPPDKPLLRSEGPTLLGPGGGTVFQDENGNWWLGFAAWIDSGTTEATGHRKLFFRRLNFVNGRPALQAANGTFPGQALAERLAGGTRYETAAQFSANLVQPKRPVTYVATGAAFPDALAAGPASGFEGSPVLLVTRDGVPAAVKTELCRVNPGHIVVMGGTGAISDAVYNDVRSCAIGGSAHREPGANRYDTAARVSANTYKTPPPVAYVATGESFADALAGGAAGARNKGPLLLVRKDAVPAETARELARLKPGRIVVLGGPGAVSDATFNGLKQYAGTVTRVAGATRYATAAQLARQEFGTLVGGLVIATGQQFTDAVAEC